MLRTDAVPEGGEDVSEEGGARGGGGAQAR